MSQGWAGYDPSHMSGLYPNEVATDFGFLPFGGGARKCIGDQFAIMETSVIMVRTLRMLCVLRALDEGAGLCV